jgi:hypothetical protein
MPDSPILNLTASARLADDQTNHRTGLASAF